MRGRDLSSGQTAARHSRDAGWEASFRDVERFAAYGARAWMKIARPRTNAPTALGVIDRVGAQVDRSLAYRIRS